MKVRWLEESIRLRITPTELARLVMGSAVGEQIRFPGGASWHVAVVPGARATGIAATVRGVVVRLTAADVTALADGETEGMYFQTGDDPPLRYYVEKDFPCAHPHHPAVCESETERFAPTRSYLLRKRASHLEHR